MNEAHRQSYLRALGLTPWVAHAPLPGAAAPVWLERAEEEDAPGERAPVSADATPSAVVRSPEPAAPASPAEPVAAEPAAVTPAATQDALIFTLEAHLAGDTWLLFQQDDPQAPELGRHAGPLAASLLAVFGGVPDRPRRFYCPLAGEPMAAAEASQALAAFVEGLASRQGGARVLLCVDEPLLEALFQQPRYTAFSLGERPALAVSSLLEMLEQPARHKRRSWQAMVAAGFQTVS